MRYLKIPADDSQAIIEMHPGDITTSKLFELMRLELRGYVQRVRIGQASSRRGFEKVIMLVDEDGHFKNLNPNMRASYLYGVQAHGQIIVGDAFIVGEHMTHEGADFTDLPTHWTLENLENFLANDDAEALFDV